VLVLLGAGFSGFWFHLGLFQSVPNLKDYDYYCYSSGCLSLLLAFLNTTVDSAYETCSSIQTSSLAGNLSQYEMVDYFLDEFAPESVESAVLEDFLPRLNVLVTTANAGVDIQTPTNRRELIDLLVKTTWIPFVTGRGVLTDDDGHYLDGGFSRVLHPKCDHEVYVPVTWNTFIHTLNPGFDRKLVNEFWEMGQAIKGHPFTDSSDVGRLVVADAASSHSWNPIVGSTIALTSQ
jgi:hypothetical protein